MAPPDKASADPAPTDLVALVEALARTRVLCVGDVMLDHYISGRVERISPEAPVPVLRIEGEESRLGGAGNVVHNLRALGAETCFISVTGHDPAGREIARMMSKLGNAESHLLAERDRVTSVKTRYVADTQQLLRADQERVAPLQAETRADLLAQLKAALGHYQIVILSDYAKGVLGDGLAAEIIAAANKAGRKVIVDPKGGDYSIYRGAFLLKPNRRELCVASSRTSLDTPEEMVAVSLDLIQRHNFGAILVSCGKDGMVLVESKDKVHRLPASAREVYDVTGAGDTVVAVLGAALASGASLVDAATLANAAAGLVVGKVGTAVVEAKELASSILDRDTLKSRKVLPLTLALDQAARWRRKGLKVGFTNGCFDLIHPGHVALLEQARKECDRLVVGINSDASVKKLKGPTRPVQNEAARASVLASLADVDLVVIFDADTPIELIKSLRPEILVKGADYKLDQVVGAEVVQSYGGKVVLADLVAGYSTTATIARAAR
jgi:D-beta-D-heptose 7-phosphate kinase/D-beta-D-heptose 1-phosphate adenosyltransferase